MPNTDSDRQETFDFQAIGSAFRVMQLDVEGLSAAKRQLIGTTTTCFPGGFTYRFAFSWWGCCSVAWCFRQKL